MNYFLRLLEIPKTGCLLGASVDTVVLVTINLKMNSFRDSSVFSKAKVRPATSPFLYHPTSGLMQILHVDWLRYYRSISNSHRVAKFAGFVDLFISFYSLINIFLLNYYCFFLSE